MKMASSFCSVSFPLLWKGQRENEIQMSSWLDLRWEIKRENWGQFTWMCIEVSSHFVHDYPATDRPNVSKLSAKLWFSPRRHLLCPPRSHFQTSKKVTAKTQILFRGWHYIVWKRNPFSPFRHLQLWTGLLGDQPRHLHHLENTTFCVCLIKYSNIWVWD